MRGWYKYEIGILNIGYLLVVSGIVMNIMHYSFGFVLLAIGIIISLVDFILSLFKLEIKIPIWLPFGREDKDGNDADILDLPESKSKDNGVYNKIVNAMYYISGGFIVFGVILKILHQSGGNALIIIGALFAVVWWLLHMFSTRIK